MLVPASMRLMLHLLCTAVHRLAGCLLVSGLSFASLAAWAEPWSPSERPTSSTAVAVSGDHTATAADQPNDVAAAMLALSLCEQKRQGAGSACEVVRLNAERVTTGAEIRKRATTEPHPLYLWQLKSATADVFLAGSIHILKPSIYPLPAQLEAAFQRADYLVVEVDTRALEPADVSRLTLQYGLLPRNETLSGVLPQPLYRRLARRTADFGINIDLVSGAKPALVTNQLVVARLMALGYLPDYGIEQYFLQRADRLSILELETLEQQLELLLNQPLDMQIALLADTLDQERVIEPLLTEMLVAWLDGDDEQFLSLFEQQSGQSPYAIAFNDALLDKRNVGMANKIRGYLSGNGTYFVLIGAAHFLGEAGIIARLENEGVSVKRIQSTDVL